MLSRLVLLTTQLVAGWLMSRSILDALPPFGNLRLFAHAVVAAVIVWMVGLVLAQVLRDTLAPSSATLMSCVIFALIGAAIIFFRESLPEEARAATRTVRDDIVPLAGAVLGYFIKR